MGEAKKVRLRIVSRQIQPDGDVFETKHARLGRLTDGPDGMTLEYEDVQDEEKANIVLSMNAGRMPGENCARMQRRGMTSGTLTFLPGQRVGGSYVTMYGEIPIAVHTHSVSIERAENGGALMLHYDVYMGGERTSTARMEVTWRV